MHPHAFALHITWTTYGSWLPGDERGSVSNRLKPEGGFDRKQNTPGAPLMSDEFTRESARRNQTNPTVLLTREQAGWVAEELVAVATKEGWRILRAAVMYNHTHVVVIDCPDNGPAVQRKLKGVTQAALSRRNGRPRKWWTDGGSDRCKHDPEAIEAAINYDAKQPGMLAGVADMRPFIVGDDGELCYLDG